MLIKKDIEIRGLIQAWKMDTITGLILPIHVQEFKSFKKNLVPSCYREDIAKNAVGTSADIEIKYTELSTNYDPPTRNDGGTLVLGIGRVAPTITRTNNRILIESTFSITDANTLGADGTVTVSAVTSTTVFTLTSVTGLAVNDRCKLKLSAAGNREEHRKITNISGNIVTVDKALPVSPTIGDKFYQEISQVILAYGGSATLTLNTGSAASMASLVATKESTEILLTRHEMEFLG